MRLGDTSGDPAEDGGNRRPRRRPAGGRTRRPRPPADSRPSPSPDGEDRRPPPEDGGPPQDDRSPRARRNDSDAPRPDRGAPPQDGSGSPGQDGPDSPHRGNAGAPRRRTGKAGAPRPPQDGPGPPPRRKGPGEGGRPQDRPAPDGPDAPGEGSTDAPSGEHGGAQGETHTYPSLDPPAHGNEHDGPPDKQYTKPARSGPAGRQRGRPSAPGQGRKRRSPGQSAKPPAGPRFATKPTTASIIGWTSLSALVPGAAHLRAGRRRTGFALLGAFAVLLLAGAAVALANMDSVGFAVRDSTLITVAVLAGVGALAWFLLLLTSYVALKPNRLTGAGQIVSGIVVGVLCVLVMTPFALTANSVLTARELANSIFRDEPLGNAAPIKHEDPWNGKDRVNFLLVGGDAAGNRTGVRTDSMNVASVHVKTGNTVMYSLPRNLQHVRFPASSPLAKQFPNGFMAELGAGGLLNEVWQYANDHPEIMGGKNQGPKALKDAIGHTLGMKIDYYALVNMYGFADLVDAIGGLKIRVERDIPWGGHYGTAGTIRAGYRKLSGEEALWYGRSRVGSDDFSRMARQRCVIGAFAQQATPAVVLANFNKIANATKRLASTDIPRALLEHLADLALKVRGAKITSLQFVPPQFWPGAPDWAKIRRESAKSLEQSLQPDRRPLAANVTASPGAESPSATPTRKTPKSPTATPTKNNKGAKGLDELCGF
ncbi:LCP family glycopolymer transferase [Streptosporangium soli]|nr:LCP family protein [Streptosporangium sp. KLBMP 9127]